MKSRKHSKGFAITSVLYTLFILFLLIMVSVLTGLRAKKNMLEQSIVGLEDSFVGKELCNNTSDCQSIISDNISPKDGKYIFTTSEHPDLICSTYLKKGRNFQTATYIPDTCNTYELDLTISKIISFEEGEDE